MNTSAPLISGRPRFAAIEWQTLADREGQAAAWRKAFADHGRQAPLLAGDDFAIALTAADGKTYLAVDRFATRTLCYRVRDGKLHFAERADELADAVPELDLQAIYDYLYFHCIPSPRTIFKGIFRVPPAHCAVYENGRLSVEPYWTPQFVEPARPSFTGLRDRFRQLLRDAVARRLDRQPTACFLSGGTDSSTVAGLVCELSGKPAETYSIGFDAQGYDEMEYARIAARHFGARHHELYITPADLVANIPKVAAHFDQPFGNSSALPAYYCALTARNDGFAALLAGDGGDELFGGNTRYAKQRVFDFYRSIPAPLRSAIIEPALVDSGLFDAIPLLGKAASYARQARVPMPERTQTYNLLQRLGIAEVLTPAFLATVDTRDPLRQQREIYAAVADPALINRMLAFDWRYTLAENDLPKVCGATGLAGIAVEFPLLDQDLLEFSLSLPNRYKLNGLKLRWFFKEALRGFLPEQILTKKKHGFGLPFGVWANRDPALGALARDSLRGFAERGIVAPAFVAALLDRHLPEHPGYYGEMVWILMMLEQWLRARAADFRIVH